VSDDRHHYSTDDRSSLQLIEQEFAMSRRRSRTRHATSRPGRWPMTRLDVLPATVIVVVVVLLLTVARLAWPGI